MQIKLCLNHSLRERQRQSKSFGEVCLGSLGTSLESFCNSRDFQTLNWVLRLVILLKIEFCYSGIVNLIFKISRLVLYYITWFIAFQFNCKIISILIDYLNYIQMQWYEISVFLIIIMWNYVILKLSITIFLG